VAYMGSLGTAACFLSQLASSFAGPRNPDGGGMDSESARYDTG
jgi:hypothetical protein